MTGAGAFARIKLMVAVFATTISFFSTAADVSGRRMVWAHYVPWLTPDNASQMSDRFYDFPQFDVGDDPFRAEIERAMSEGIDGFFNDMVAHPGGSTSFWDLRPFLKAAEGTPFQFGICLDAKIPVEQQVKELVKMLSAYGDHPNYPKWGDRYVVDTYTFFAWSPDEWRAIRKGCAEAGYPIYVIANIETGYTAYSDAKLDPYAGLVDRAYFFSNNGTAFTGFKSLETENREAADWCARHGAKFMPCLWPGYYGGWLNGRCSYYQPFLGFDALLRRWNCAQTLGCDWLHVTTWNDHDETTLQSRRLTTGNPAIVRAMADAFKGRPVAAHADIQFAYLRETIPGTVLRIETMRLPSSDDAAIEVCGILRDLEGEAVAELSPRKLSGDWDRGEWLVPTAALAGSPVLTPEFSVTGRDGTRRVTTPPVFLVTPFLRNPETVKVSVNDRRAVRNGFGLDWKDGVLEGYCAFEGEVPLKRAVLYRNDRPVTAFVHGRKTVLPVALSGEGRVDLQVSGGRIACAVKSFETNGAPNFAWTETQLVSKMTPLWMKMSARIETDENALLTLIDNDVKRSISPRDLVRFALFKSGKATLRLAPDGTLYNLPPLNEKRGKLDLSVWSEKPDPTDAFWVEFEFADGTFAESRVKYPFAEARHPVRLNVVETAVTLDHTSGAAGLPDTRVFLTPDADLPICKSRVTEAEVSPLSIRRERFDFSNAPMDRPKLPQRRWPMGPFRLSCAFTPLAQDGADHAILQKGGWNEGPELRLLADGRLEAVFAGGAGTNAFSHAVKSAKPLVRGQKVRIGLVNDGRTFTLSLDGAVQGECRLPPLRAYGNLSPSIGGGINGKDPSVGLLHDLEFSGDPQSELEVERLSLNPIFTDHMVFAEGKPMRIFGTGLGPVTVTFRGKSVRARSLGGEWMAELPPATAGGPFELEVDLGGRKSVLRDVCVGEVYLMSGQSNMQFVLSRSSVKPSAYVDEPRLRCFGVSRVEPGAGLRSEEGWRPCGKANAAQWSTLAYLVGLERVRRRGVPVGMVVCAQGASVLRSWIPETMCTEPRFAIDPKEMHFDFRSPVYSLWNGPGFLYKNMFEKLVPFSFSRTVWYQGESDTGPGGSRYYANMLAAMIDRWRGDLRDSDLPFTVVQIADLDSRRDEHWRGVQLAQEKVAGLASRVTVVKSADVSCTTDIHPPDKTALARRIAESQE